jgi:hypothetical protein
MVDNVIITVDSACIENGKNDPVLRARLKHNQNEEQKQDFFIFFSRFLLDAHGGEGCHAS